ncbi:MAG: methyltransferase domain-containing protein [Ktedonobacteraceae bacterium]|nr:methyltransferase domain-containing protein [Ktedonobacteraceae bacterium]
MSEKTHDSTPADVFDRIYREEEDPWGYTSRQYERTKYNVTLATLPQERYAQALEIGCSIGVMTALLAPRCDALLAVDHSHIAVDRAKARCSIFDHITFACRSIPHDFPHETFDLILLSEVGFYWSREDLAVAHAMMTSHLRPQGHLLLVHWTVPCAEHPLSAETVHEQFLQEPHLEHLLHLRAIMEKNSYRLDLFQRR